MVPETLESRVERLEQQMSLVISGQSNTSQPASDDWKQTVGMFRGDAVVAEMIEHSQRMREDERQRARRRGT